MDLSSLPYLMAKCTFTRQHGENLGTMMTSFSALGRMIAAGYRMDNMQDRVGFCGRESEVAFFCL